MHARAHARTRSDAAAAVVLRALRRVRGRAGIAAHKPGGGARALCRTRHDARDAGDGVATVGAELGEADEAVTARNVHTEA